MKKNSKIILLFVMFCFYLPPSVRAQSSQTPEQSLEQTFSSYARFTAYQDQGSAEKLVKGNKGDSHISTTTFSTFIKRPDKLRMEWHDARFAEQRRSVMTSDLQGINLFLAWTNRYTRMDSSAGSWGTVFGVSGDQTYIVPSIMEIGYNQINPGPSWLASMRELRLLESQEFEGALCYVIPGKWGPDADYRVWIGVNDHLLRQIEEQVQSLNKANKEKGPEQKQDKGWLSKLFPPDSTDYSLSSRQVFREIKINQQINDEVFQFTPPPGAKFVERDGLIEAIPDRIKRWLLIPLLFLILSFIALSLVIWAILKKKVAGPKN